MEEEKTDQRSSLHAFRKEARGRVVEERRRIVAVVEGSLSLRRKPSLGVVGG